MDIGICMGFPGGARSHLPIQVDITGVSSIPVLGRYPGRGHSNPLQYSCLENSMDRGVWWAAVHGVSEWDATEAI